jgi:hypothetical protein
MVDGKAPGGTGANDGYWEEQLRDRYGRFMEMGGDVLFEVTLPGVQGEVQAKGKFIGATDMTTARIEVLDNSEIPRGIYLIKTDKIENIQAVIPAEYLEEQLDKAKDLAKPLKKSMLGSEVQKEKLRTVARNLKAQGRFPIPRQSMNDTMGKTSDVSVAAKADYKKVYDASPELQEKYSSPEELWDRVYKLAVDTDWSSPNELSEIPEEMRLINRQYAKHFLGLEEDGLITVYRNAVGGKNSQVDAAAGYVTTDMSFAYDYNSKKENVGANGRYEIDVKPDEVFGMLGYSKPEDEFAFVIGKGVTSQEGRVRRVGDLAPLPMPAPWMQKYEKEISYATGATPYRHHALGGQFNFHEVENFGNTAEEFFSKYNLTSADIKSKFDQLYGDGAYDEYKASEGTISFNTIRRMFVDLPNGKIGLDITKIQGGRDGVLTMARYGEGGPDTFKNDRTDTSLKMMSVFQELTGQPFFTHRSRDYVPGAEQPSEEESIRPRVEGKGDASIFEGALDVEVFDISKLDGRRHYSEDPEMFSPEEVAAIKLYTGSAAFKIWNKALRNDDTEKLSEIKNDIELLDAIIADHGEVFEPARVFRGLYIGDKSSSVDWKNIMENLSIGDTFTEAGYMSTSNDPEVAYGSFGGGVGGKLLAEDGQFGGSRYMSNNALGQGSVFWSIDLPVGSKAFGVPDGMGHQGESEDEVILPRGSSVTVKSIRKVQHVDSDGNPVVDAFNYFLETELAPSATPEAIDIVDRAGVETEPQGKVWDGVPFNPEFMDDNGNTAYDIQEPNPPKTGYHVAPKSAREDILKNGLDAKDTTWNTGIGMSGTEVFRDEHLWTKDDEGNDWAYEYRPIGIYMFDDLDRARAYAGDDDNIYEIDTVSNGREIIRDPVSAANWDYLMDEEKSWVTRYVQPESLKLIDDSVAKSWEQDFPRYNFENSKTGWKYSDEHVVGIGGRDRPTDEELDAIATYIGDGYSQMNDVTRGYDPGDDPFFREDIDTHVENLTNLIDRNPPLGTTALVYRGVYDSAGMKWSDLEVGSELIDRGFVSTTNSIPTARGFGNIQLEIELGEDTKLIDVSETVEGTRVPVKESEIILQRGTKFEVVAKTEEGFRLRVVGISRPETMGSQPEAAEEIINSPETSEQLSIIVDGTSTIVDKRGNTINPGEEVEVPYSIYEIGKGSRNAEKPLKAIFTGYKESDFSAGKGIETKNRAILYVPEQDGTHAGYYGVSSYVINADPNSDDFRGVGGTSPVDIDGFSEKYVLPSPKQMTSLSEQEAEEIIDYTNHKGSYLEINSSLRDDSVSEETQEKIDVLDKIIGYNQILEDQDYYRGIPIPLGLSLEEFLTSLDSGEIEELQETGFSSTSTDEQMASIFANKYFGGGVVLRIKAKAGQSAYYVPRFLAGVIANENEVILPRSTKYRIISHEFFPENKKVVLEVEIV